MSSTRPSRIHRWVTFAGLLAAILAGGACMARAQAFPSGRANRGMNLYETFQASESPSGSVLSMSNTVGYAFSQRLGVDVTVPFYFVVPPTQRNGFAGTAAGLGNLSMDGRFVLETPLLDYLPTATVTFPTGNTTKGFSTGTITYDLDNRFEHAFGLITPFFDVDVGNSLNNGSSPFRRQIQRPFLTLGNVVNFMVGPEIHLTDRWTVSGDAYQAVPWGPQTVYSRVALPGLIGKGGKHNRTFEIVQRQVGGAKLVYDYGYDASVAFSPRRSIDLTLAYDRSVYYGLNTVSFSVGFNLSEMLSRPRY